MLSSSDDLKGYLPGSAPCPGPSSEALSPQAAPVASGETGDGDLPETQPGSLPPGIPSDLREDSEQQPGDVCEIPAPGIPDKEVLTNHGLENEVPATPGVASIPQQQCSERDTRKRTREDDEFASASVPPEILSEKAIYNRLYRVFVKRSDGSYILDDQWVKAWNDIDGDGRASLYSMFEKVGYKRDRYD